ncbi:MAG: tyrosine-type recombinase/integrase [Desulfobacteraceae bacterium]|nr:MAG: tyrosine-type recombinase/integrase [Desulfobacteraceae bacterium]
MAKVTRVEGKKGVSYRIDYFDPNGKRIRKMFKKKKDAEAELGKRVSLMAEGRYLDIKEKSKLTLKEMVDLYKEKHKNQKYFMGTKHYFLSKFQEYMGAETLISNIAWKDIGGYRTHLTNQITVRGGLRKPASINREMSSIRHLMSYAVTKDELSKDDFDKMFPFIKGDRDNRLFLKEDNARLVFLTHEEITRLLAECEHLPLLHRLVTFGINTGLDKGDILKLTWDNIIDGKICTRRAKTGNLVEIPINEAVKKVLKDIRKEQPLGTSLIFCRDGKAIKKFDKGFNGAIRRAKLKTKGVTFKSLRHTFASHLIMRGRHLKEVQELLGHKNIAMTLRYAHLEPHHLEDAVKSLDGLTDHVEKVQEAPLKNMAEI